MFYDKVKIQIKSGKGGNGCCSFRREKYVPRGGPNGGSGGSGGNVVLQANKNINTLIDFRYKKKFTAPNGQSGQGSNKHGKNAEDLIVQVPAGTLVKQQQDKEEILLADLTKHEQQAQVARGGKGGLGNAMLATPHYQAPHFAELGEPGEEKELILELKLIADVGLIGYPNVGKSTLISVVSNAKVKIADYPFTTLSPNLGVVKGNNTDFTIADIPGLIKGAHQGKGLGYDFLRHIERTRVLIHLLDGSKIKPKQLRQDFEAIIKELELFDKRILAKPQLVAVNKIDVLSDEQIKEIQTDKELAESIQKFSDQPLQMISAAAHTNIEHLLQLTADMLRANPKPDTDQEVIKIYKPLEENEKIFYIEKDKHGFRVRGRRAERIAVTTDMSNPEAVQWMQDRLKNMGVFDELEKQGIQIGDKVSIASIEFEWD